MTSKPPSPPSLLHDVRAILRDARRKTYAAANAAMVGLLAVAPGSVSDDFPGTREIASSKTPRDDGA